MDEKLRIVQKRLLFSIHHVQLISNLEINLMLTSCKGRQIR